jgi:hypothetical protein
MQELLEAQVIPVHKVNVVQQDQEVKCRVAESQI